MAIHRIFMSWYMMNSVARIFLRIGEQGFYSLQELKCLLVNNVGKCKTDGRWIQISHLSVTEQDSSELQKPLKKYGFFADSCSLIKF